MGCTELITLAKFGSNSSASGSVTLCTEKITGIWSHMITINTQNRQGGVCESHTNGAEQCGMTILTDLSFQSKQSILTHTMMNIIRQLVHVYMHVQHGCNKTMSVHAPIQYRVTGTTQSTDHIV